MDSWRGLARARWPVCIVAAFGVHGLAARALPAQAHHAAPPVLADAPAIPLDVDQERAPVAAAPDSVVTEPPVSVARAAPAVEARAPAATDEVVAAPEDSASDSTAPSSADGWSDGEGGNGSGRGARGGRGAGRLEGHDHHAPGGRGSGARARRARGKASLEKGRDWSDCPFPKEAVRRTAFVRIAVLVDAQGNAADVKVLSDPGEGFGEAARACAKVRRYVAGTNEDGEKDAIETEPFLVYFTR